MKKCCVFLLCYLFCAGLSAQTTTVVYGNLGVENVNISVLNTQHGTVTDAQGDYTLRLAEKNHRVNLLYSCIGYQDTVVGLNPRQLERDSIHISFRMQKQEYALKEVNILGDRPHFEGDQNIIMDFEVYDGIICILQGNGSRYRLLLADEDITVFDTIPVPPNIKPSGLLKDCLGNCQLMASDSVYQIDLKDKTTPFFATERHRYNAIMGDCLFLVDKYLYLKATTMTGFSTVFYRIDAETKEKQPLFVNDGSDAYLDYINEIKYHLKNPLEAGRTVKLEDWERYVRLFWYRDSSAHLALADDKLVFFDNDHGVIHQYDLELNELGVCPIDYPQLSDWKPRIFQDESSNRFYTMLGHWLNEIDINTGAVTPKTKIDVDLLNKVSLWNKHLYVLKRQHTSSGRVRSYIERIEV